MFPAKLFKNFLLSGLLAFFNAPGRTPSSGSSSSHSMHNVVNVAASILASKLFDGSIPFLHFSYNITSINEYFVATQGTAIIATRLVEVIHAKLKFNHKLKCI